MAEPVDNNQGAGKRPTMSFSADGAIVDPTAAPPKKVIRTFASDFAALSGKPQAGAPTASPGAVPAEEKPAAPAPKPVEPAPTVELPKPEPAPIPPPAPAPIPAAPAWTPPKLQPTYSVDADLATVAPPVAPPPVPAPKRASQPAAEPKVYERIVEKKELGFFARLFASLFAPKAADPLEGKILTSTVVRKKEPAPDAAPPPAWTPPPAPVAPPPAPLPQPVPEPLSAPAPADQERDAVLARLRERVAARGAEAAPPVFPTPPPEPRSVPPPAYQGPPANLPGAASNEPRVPEPLQTYTGDFAKRIDSERASAFAVIAADADRRRNAPAPMRSNIPKQPGLLYVVVATILVVGGTTSLYLAYSYWKSGEPLLIPTPASTLIAADEEAKVRKEDGDAFRLFRDAAEAPQPDGSIRVVYYTIATSTATGVSDIRQPGTVFLSAMRLRAPDVLTRSVRSESTVGGVGAGGGSHPFFVLRTTSYERSFSGMLAWEGTLAQDLAILYPEYDGGLPAPGGWSATTTEALASSTAPVQTPAPARGERAFRDEVVESYDVRVLRDEQGRSIMLYGYRDERTLIIVRDEKAFAAILTRLIDTGTP